MERTESEAAEQATSHSSLSRQKLLITILVSVLVLVGGITGGVFAFQKYQHSQAVSACVKTVTPLQNALTNLRTQHSAKATTELVKLDVKKLADKSTHDKLAEAVKPVSVTITPCTTTLSTAQLTANTGKNKSALARVETATANLTSAVDKLTASRTLQSRNLLTAEVKAGQKLVKDSQGKVQDQKTLDQLNTVLTASNKLAQEKTADYTKLDKQLDELKKAEQSVRDSVEAKRKADEEAARKAEEARQAQAAAAAQQRTYSAPAQGYSAPRYQAPARNYQAPSQNTQQSFTPGGFGANLGSTHEWNGKPPSKEGFCRATGYCD